jgi:NAD-dependent dihydropyrimidine dehydrogenase PreA subunit
MAFVVRIDHTKCSGNGSCCNVCPVEIYEKPHDGKCWVKKEKIKKPIKEKNMQGGACPECIGCTACVSACPAQAITIEEEK